MGLLWSSGLGLLGSTPSRAHDAMRGGVGWAGHPVGLGIEDKTRFLSLSGTALH